MSTSSWPVPYPTNWTIRQHIIMLWCKENHNNLFIEFIRFTIHRCCAGIWIPLWQKFARWASDAKQGKHSEDSNNGTPHLQGSVFHSHKFPKCDLYVAIVSSVIRTDSFTEILLMYCPISRPYSRMDKGWSLTASAPWDRSLNCDKSMTGSASYGLPFCSMSMIFLKVITTYAIRLCNFAII